MKPLRTLAALSALTLATVPLDAQQGRPRSEAQRRPPLTGTVSPRAIGRPAPTPVPIGGLRTRPLTPPQNFPRPIGADPSRFRDRNGNVTVFAMAIAIVIRTATVMATGTATSVIATATATTMERARDTPTAGGCPTAMDATIRLASATRR